MSNTLLGKTPKDTFDRLLWVPNGTDGEAQPIKTGDGQDTPIAISKDELAIHGLKWPSGVPLEGESIVMGEDGELAWAPVAAGSQAPTQELILKANFVGPVIPTSGASRFYPPSDIEICKVYCSINTPGSGANEVDVKVDGISIFGQVRPSLASNQYRSVDYPIIHAVRSTSYITVDVVNGSGSDLVVYIVYR